MSKTSVFAVILAGGVGKRMGNIEKPKQFIQIGGKAILIHTVEKFLAHEEFEKVIVLTPKQWVRHTCDLMDKSALTSEKIVVIEGGETRNETVLNAIRYISENCALTEDTVIVTHDSVRPFVTYRIIEENIKAALEFGACDTVFPATDTIVESLDNEMITAIPERRFMYQGQTPQSFKAKKLQELYDTMSPAEKETLTDACKIFQMKGEPVKLVIGEMFNIKITYPYDIKVAQSFVGEQDA